MQLGRRTGGVPQAAFGQHAAMPPVGFWPQAPTVPADSSATYYGESGVYPIGGQQQAAFVQFAPWPPPYV